MPALKPKMKKIIVTLFVLSGMLGFNSCSEDFQVTAPYKDITFVYALLNMKDTAHYIRIQKAFLDENKAAIDMAKDADSNFYQNLVVKVREFEFLTGNFLQEFSLSKVDLSNEGFPKDSGAFFNAPSFAYKFKYKLNPSNSYRLVVLNPLNGYKDSSEINIIDTSKLNLNIANTAKLKFDKTIPTISNIYSLNVTNNVNSHAKYMEAFIRFFWDDKNLATGTLKSNQADFYLGSRATGSTVMETFSISNQSFYYFLQNVIGAAPNDVVRYLDSCDIYLYSGGIDYSNYVTTKSFHAGITADQSQPIFTNILGKDVYGLYSTKAVKYKIQIPIDPATMDSLLINPITNSLRIVGVTNH